MPAEQHWWSWLESDEGMPPPGRHRASLEEVAANLVAESRFAQSQTRPQLWEDLLTYLLYWTELEEVHAEVLDGRSLLHYAWLGGSFVSTKDDPNNVDFSLIVDGEARDAVRGRPHSRWLTRAFSRDYVRDKLGLRLAPLQVIHRPVISPFKMQNVERAETAYLASRGGWDDWWQRCRNDDLSDPAPSLHTVTPRRGYVEVTL